VQTTHVFNEIGADTEHDGGASQPKGSEDVTDRSSEAVCAGSPRGIARVVSVVGVGRHYEWKLNLNW